MYYINCFFIYSVLGFLLETLIALVSNSNFKSGILFGPWTPIYGIGVVVILLLSNYFFMNLHMPRWKETIIVFIIVAIFLSCLELIGGVLIEKYSGIRFWDYTGHRFHIGTYISLEMTFIWGVASIFFIYIINPLVEKYIKMFPSYIVIPLLLIMMVDFVYTLFSTIKK